MKNKLDIELINYATNYGYRVLDESTARMVPWGRCMDKLNAM